jgi:GNAT superfamily N-acetyltransferase
MLSVLAACERTWAAFATTGWEPPPQGGGHWVRELGGEHDWTRVADEPGRGVVGFVSFSAARDAIGGPELPGVANLDALFVHPDRWGRGIGGRLLEAAMVAMRERGFRRGRLYTPQGAPAERFYAAHGWTPDGRLAWHHVLRFAVVGYALEL